MYAAQATILVALAVFSVAAARLSHPAAPAQASPESGQLKAFIHVGAAGLLIVAVVVIVVGVTANRAARAEGLAMFGFFTYAIYLLAVFVIEQVTPRR